LCPRDIAPKIYKIARKRRHSVKKALDDDFWVSQINIQEGLRVDRISQFYMLGEKLQVVHTHHDREDSISLKFGKHGTY
jgi:hypothetical protein